MDKFGIQLLFLFIQLILLYPLIQRSTTELFRLVYLLTRSRDAAFAVIAVLFLPGTIIHEMSHFFAATVLLLPVGEVRILPEWHGDRIRLGRVTYAKADFIRSVLVGIAPVFGAIFIFSLLYLFRLFPSSSTWVTLGWGYLLFTVSANMFSSKQDLVDLVYIIPASLIAAALWYLSGITVRIQIPSSYFNGPISMLQFVNFCITISLAVHFAITVLIRSLWFLIKR